MFEISIAFNLAFNISIVENFIAFDFETILSNEITIYDNVFVCVKIFTIAKIYSII